MIILSRKYLSIALVFALALITSCSDDEATSPEPFGIAFESTSAGIQDGSNEVTVKITFSRSTFVANQVTIKMQENGVEYGTDFRTDPEAVNGILFLDIPAGVNEKSFKVIRTGDAISDGNNVTFTLDELKGEEEAQIAGNTSIEVNFSAVASSGAAMVAEIGGPTQPNQTFIDLSLNEQTSAKRTSWDLGLYSGSADKVIVNYATYGMAVKTDKTDINAVSAADTTDFSRKARIGTAGAHIYIDSPDGDLSKLAIADISENDSENPVYIINRGAGPGTEAVDPGSVNVGGTLLGWKKVRILKRGNDYLIQHADIAATSFTETTISRTADFTFSYFSFDASEAVSVKPATAKWDFEFTVSSNVINFGAGDGAYGFSDYIKVNREGGVEVAVVTLERDDDGNILDGQTTYSQFTSADAATLIFSNAADVIGSGWRSVFSRTAHNYRFYLVKDTEGNTYKVQFTGLMNQLGERGNSSFKYELL